MRYAPPQEVHSRDLFALSASNFGKQEFFKNRSMHSAYGNLVLKTRKTQGNASKHKTPHKQPEESHGLGYRHLQYDPYGSPRSRTPQLS